MCIAVAARDLIQRLLGQLDALLARELQQLVHRLAVPRLCLLLVGERVIDALEDLLQLGVDALVLVFVHGDTLLSFVFLSVDTMVFSIWQHFLEICQIFLKSPSFSCTRSYQPPL